MQKITFFLFCFFNNVYFQNLSFIAYGLKTHTVHPKVIFLFAAQLFRNAVVEFRTQADGFSLLFFGSSAVSPGSIHTP